ncbi:BZ3500_MvSof-1268-A1-R1_Chr3-2g06230 [Microbotryum saponariae]|uniref:BZ3500_MvSof-1268-A1-R1_Chr3-2g06230 protein n=1 Tax=Microbotryum saponariae TaxID=289078 RepID=A0A2X0NGG2_9BASI|nr:BZ3500_MvSof-1268-A1-R1_Chr3-2g06230 [Microbotryum saponariae]SDA04167.1 BZ3501_MvSof-1269-A2-R1_Chr3-2g05921 [Microbotryum saponariae]
MPDLSWFHSALLLSCLGTLALSHPIILGPHHLYDSSHAAQGLVHPDALRGQLVQTPSALLNALSLRNAEIFVWANANSKGTRGTSQVAVMQMDTLDQEKAINMQRFSHLLANVRCKPSQVTVQFVTKAAFEVASQLWSALNSDNITHLNLFTNWKGCYTDGGNLKPFHLTKVSFDSKQLAATLTGSETDWKTAAHTFTMSIGKHFDETLAAAGGSSRPLLTRSSIFTKAEKKIKKDFAAELNSVAKSIDRAKSKILKGIKKGLNATLVNINQDLRVTFDKPHTATKTLSTPSLGGSVTCTACGAHGSLGVRIIIKVTLAAMQPVKLTMKPQNLGVSLGLAMSAKSDLPESFEIENPLFEQPIPGAGLVIPELATVGLTASLDYGISVSNFTGGLNVAKNVSVSIPDGAEVDLLVTHSNDEQPTLRGSWAPVAQPTPMQVSGFGSGEFAVGLGISLSLKMEVMSLDITPIKITLGGPSVGFEFGVSSKGSGPCPSLSSSHDPTYYITPKIGFSLSIGSGLSVGPGMWGLGSPIPASGGPNKNSSQATGSSGGGGGGSNPPHPSSTHTNPDQKDSSQLAVETRSVTKRHNHDSIGASKMSISASKTLFEKSFQLHNPICFTSRHHQRRPLSNNGRKDEPDGGPRRLPNSSE